MATILMICISDYNATRSANTAGEKRKYMKTINYNGKQYNAEIVEGYYDMDKTNYSDLGAANQQEFFEKYLELDPDFAELFKYDIKPIV